MVDLHELISAMLTSPQSDQLNNGAHDHHAAQCYHHPHGRVHCYEGCHQEPLGLLQILIINVGSLVHPGQGEDVLLHTVQHGELGAWLQRQTYLNSFMSLQRHP